MSGLGCKNDRNVEGHLATEFAFTAQTQLSSFNCSDEEKRNKYIRESYSFSYLADFKCALSSCVRCDVISIKINYFLTRNVMTPRHVSRYQVNSAIVKRCGMFNTSLGLNWDKIIIAEGGAQGP